MDSRLYSLKEAVTMLIAITSQTTNLLRWAGTTMTGEHPDDLEAAVPEGKHIIIGQATILGGAVQVECR
jgi:hypothetical protein